MEEVKEAENALKKGEHPMKIKKQLAFEITKELTNLDEAESAKERVLKEESKDREKPIEMKKIVSPYLSTVGKIDIIDLLVD